MSRNFFSACLFVFCVTSFTHSISAQSLENTVDQKNDDQIAALTAQINHLQTQIETLKRRLDESKNPAPLVVALPFPDTVSKLTNEPTPRHCKIVMSILVDPKDKDHANEIMSNRAGNVQSKINELLAQKTTDELTGGANRSRLRRDIQRIVADELEIPCIVKLKELNLQ